MNMEISGYEQNVRERAYFLWENEGRPMGRHVEHWLSAEDALRAEPEAACAQEPAAPAEMVAAAPKPARAKKAAAPKPKAAAAPKKKPSVAALRRASAPEMPATLQ